MDVLIAYHGMARGSLDPTCGDRFTVSRALLCKGDFVAQRHDGIQNILTSLLSKVCKDVDVKLHLLPIDSEVFNLRSTVTSPEAILDIKAGSSGHGEKQHSSMYVERTWTQRVTRTNPQNRSSWSMRKTRKGITNKELLTWKWDLPPPPSFWHERRNGEGMQTFSEQPSRQTFPQKTASHMPVPYLVLKQAYLLKFLRSVHTYVRCEGPDPLFTRMLTF